MAKTYKSRQLTELQTQTLKVVAGLGDKANGAAITRVFMRLGIKMNGGVYNILHALEQKGLLSAHPAAEASRRGGRPQRFYRVVDKQISQIPTESDSFTD